MINEFSISIGIDSYRTIIAEEILFDAKGEPTNGLCLPAQQMILIAGAEPPAKRERIWFREAMKAIALAKQEAGDDPIAADGNLLKSVRDQFARMKAGRLLLAMKPQAGFAPKKPAPRAPLTPSTPETLAHVRRVKFGYLNDLQFQSAREQWEALGLSPFQDHFHAPLVKTPQGLQVKIVTHLRAVRLMAQRTKEYVGLSRAKFEYDDHGNLESCRVIVRRRVNGEIVKFIGEAYWEESYGLDSAYWPDVVMQRPRTCLSRVAEIDGLRKAFPDEVGDTYIEDELYASRRPRKVA